MVSSRRVLKTGYEKMWRQRIADGMKILREPHMRNSWMIFIIAFFVPNSNMSILKLPIPM